MLYTSGNHTSSPSTYDLPPLRFFLLLFFLPPALLPPPVDASPCAASPWVDDPAAASSPGSGESRPSSSSSSSSGTRSLEKRPVSVFFRDCSGEVPTMAYSSSSLELVVSSTTFRTPRDSTTFSVILPLRTIPRFGARLLSVRRLRALESLGLERRSKTSPPPFAPFWLCGVCVALLACSTASSVRAAVPPSDDAN